MKGIFCGHCFTIRSLPAQAFKIVECDCGRLMGWWLDPAKGIARYYAKDGERSGCFAVGWNNSFLTACARGEVRTSDDAKREHNSATDAPGYLFDKDKRACWCVIMWPGQSSDTAWATPQELLEITHGIQNVR